MNDTKTPKQLRELLTDREAFRQWFRSLSEEQRQSLKTDIAEQEAKAAQDEEVRDE